MGMSKAALENELRQRLLDIVIPALEGVGEQPMACNTGEYTIPVVDAEGNEIFANLKIWIPRGTRADGTYKPYDGYEAADEWKEELAAREDKKRASAEKKARQEAERERKRKAKETVKTMKKDIQEIFEGD